MIIYYRNANCFEDFEGLFIYLITFSVFSMLKEVIHRIFTFNKKKSLSEVEDKIIKLE